MKEYMGNIPLEEKVERQRKHIEALRASLKRAEDRLYKMGDWLLAQPETKELVRRLMAEGKLWTKEDEKDARSEETNQ